jgi:hypothetical protein
MCLRLMRLCLLVWWGAAPSVGEVLLLLLLPWELRVCIMPAVRDAPVFARLVGCCSFGWRSLAIAAPTLGALRMRCACCA